MPADLPLTPAVLFGGGLALGALGLWRALSRGGGADAAKAPPTPEASAGRLRTIAAVLAIVVVAVVLRVEGIDRRGMTHVEAYVPNIPLPARISEPPPRLTFGEMAHYHVHDEPHPQGYYVFTWAWTRIFGTSLVALRLPSVLFGAGAVLVAYIVTRRLVGHAAGLAAAAMLALNGHQIFWSQQARMYAMSCFLGLLATWALVELMRRGGRRPMLELGYVAAAWACCFTQLFGWMLLAGHVVAALRYARTRDGMPRQIELQGIVAILGAPLVAHAIYRSRQTPFLDRPAGAFFQDYLNFGFLFEPDLFSLPERTVPWWVAFGLTACAAACLGLAATRPRSASPFLDVAQPARGPRTLILLAAGLVLIVLGFASIAHRRQLAIALVAAVPLAVPAVLWMAGRIWPALARVRDGIARRARVPEGVGVAMILAFVPMLALISIHLVKPLVTSRGASLFTPYLLASLAAGLTAMATGRVARVVLAAVLLAAHAGSISWYRAMPAPNDHRALAAAMTSRFQPGDLVFVPARDWVTTPLFYHLQDHFGRLVGEDHGEAIRAHPRARVWVPLYSDLPPRPEIAAALSAHRVADEVTALRARALLYVR